MIWRIETQDEDLTRLKIARLGGKIRRVYKKKDTIIIIVDFWGEQDKHFENIKPHNLVGVGNEDYIPTLNLKGDHDSCNLCRTYRVHPHRAAYVKNNKTSKVIYGVENVQSILDGDIEKINGVTKDK